MIFRISSEHEGIILEFCAFLARTRSCGAVEVVRRVCGRLRPVGARWIAEWETVVQ